MSGERERAKYVKNLDALRKLRDIQAPRSILEPVFFRKISSQRERTRVLLTYLFYEILFLTR